MVLTKITISCFAFWILVCREPATAHRNQHAFTDQTTRATKLLAGDGACLAASSAVALVNTTVQLQAVQQLDLGSTTASMQQALSQYLHTSDCNIQIQFNTSSTCLTASSSNTSATCPDSTYVCRGVVQVPVNVYNAIQDSTCTPDDRTSTFPCAGSTIDLTTYLDVQQGQCCLQCPDQPDCSTDPTAASAYAPEGAAESPPQCSNFSVSVAVGDRLTGSAAQAQLADAVNNGLLDQYLHAAGLLDTTALSVGPTELVVIPEALPPEAAAAPTTSPSLVHTAESNTSSDGSCLVQLQEDTRLCEAPPGYLADMSQCPGPVPQSSWHVTGEERCSGPHWAYSPWGSCSASCGGGSSTRQAVCMANASSSSISPASVCAHAVQTQPMQRTCNVGPCSVYSWQVTPWGPCNTTCDGGLSNRTVQCMNGTSGSVADKHCMTAKPASGIACNTHACSFCQDNLCSGHGACSNGRCQCQRGLKGAYCEVAESCATGIVDAQQQCCPSGLLDISGTCCPGGTVVDKTGQCCPAGAVLDACGFCNGTGKVVDIQGHCCATVVDASGVCSENAAVDECGVSGGLSDTCAVVIQAQLQMVVLSSNITLAALQAQWQTQIRQGFATMLQIPASTISKISFSNTSRSSATRRVLAVGNSPSTVAGSPATTAPAAPQAASAAATQIVTVTVNPWHAGNTTSTSGTGQRPSTAASNTGQGRQAAAADIGQGPLTAASAARLLGSTDLAQSQANLGFAVTTVIQAYRVGVCGNGVCEVGERALNSSSGAGLLGSCPADCPGPYADCPSNGSLACSGKGQCLTNQGMCNCYPGYTGSACETCTSGWVQSQEVCIPYTPPLYKAALWRSHMASIAPAPAPAVEAFPSLAPAPLPEALQDSSPVLGAFPSLAPTSGVSALPNQVSVSAPSSQTAGIESYSPAPVSGTPLATAPAQAPGLLPAASGSGPAPASALGVGNGTLGNADSAARPDPNGSHMMLLSGTSAGGLCILVLLIAAVVCCINLRKSRKQLQQQKLYMASSEASQGGMDQGGAGGYEGGAGEYTEGVQARKLETTPKGLRQAYAKTAGLHNEDSFSNENSNPNTAELGLGVGPKPLLGLLAPDNLAFSEGAMQGHGSTGAVQLAERQRDPLTVILPTQSPQPTPDHPTPLSDQPTPLSDITSSSLGGAPTGRSGLFVGADANSPATDSPAANSPEAALYYNGLFRVSFGRHSSRSFTGVPALTPWGRRGQLMGSALRSSQSYTGSFSSSAASEDRHSQRSAQENAEHAPKRSGDMPNRSRDALDIGCLVDNTPFMKGTSRMYAGSIQQMHSGYAGRLLSQTFAPSKDALGQREDPLEPPEQPPEWVTNAPGQFGIRAHSCTTSNLSKASFSSALGSAGIRDSTAFEDGQLRDSLGSESGHRDDSVVSGAIQLRDSIAGLLQSEQSASQHSTTSGSTTAKGAAQFSGFGTSVEQITSPGLVDSAVTNPLSYSRQAEPVQLTPWPPVRLHHAEDLQHPHGQFTSSSSSSIRQTDRLQAAEVQSDALDTGRASIARPQQDSWSATGPEQENRQASAHLKELCSPADGNSLFQQPGQLQAPSALQRGDSQLSGAASQPVSESPAASTSRFKQARYVPPPPSALQRSPPGGTAPSLLPTRQIPSPPQHHYVPTALTNFATVTSPAPSAGAQGSRTSHSRPANKAPLFARTTSADSSSVLMAQHESQQQSTAVVTPPAASGLDTDRHTVSETSLDSVTGPAPAAGPRKNPHVRIQVEGRHDHMTSISDNASLSPQQRHCVLVNPHNQGMDGQSSTGSQTQTPAGPQLTPAHFHSSDSSLSLPGQGSAQSSIGNPGNFSGDDEAESSRVGDLNTPEQRQQSALAFRNVISELRQQQGNRQHSNDDVASATSSHYGVSGLDAEDSTRAVNEGTPLMPAPAPSAISDQSRLGQIAEAPVSVVYDIEVDCTGHYL